jgi:hypothetical protein
MYSSGRNRWSGVSTSIPAVYRVCMYVRSLSVVDISVYGRVDTAYVAGENTWLCTSTYKSQVEMSIYWKMRNKKDIHIVYLFSDICKRFYRENVEFLDIQEIKGRYKVDIYRRFCMYYYFLETTYYI